MPTFYSEARTMRAREVASDVATWLWVALWVVIGSRIHDAIAQFSAAGQVLQDGGANLGQAGADLGDALGGVPLVGQALDDIATGALGTAGTPFIAAGQEPSKVSSYWSPRRSSRSSGMRKFSNHSMKAGPNIQRLP